MIIATVIISQIGRYYAVWPCAKIEFTLSDPSTLVSAYPSCAEYANSTNPSAVSLVAASLGRKDSTAATVGAGLGVPFGMALWLAFLMHAVGVEIYVSFGSICVNFHPLADDNRSSASRPRKLSVYGKSVINVNLKLECVILDQLAGRLTTSATQISGFQRRKARRMRRMLNIDRVEEPVLEVRQMHGVSRFCASIFSISY